MKKLIILGLLVSITTLIAEDKITFNYPGCSKVSYDSGKSWIPQYHKITFHYPEFSKYSKNNGKNWIYLEEFKSKSGFIIEGSDINLEILNLKGFKEYKIIDNSLTVKFTGSVENNNIHLLKNLKGIYFLELKNYETSKTIKLIIK